VRRRVKLIVLLIVIQIVNSFTKYAWLDPKPMRSRPSPRRPRPSDGSPGAWGPTDGQRGSTHRVALEWLVSPPGATVRRQAGQPRGGPVKGPGGHREGPRKECRGEKNPGGSGATAAGGRAGQWCGGRKRPDCDRQRGQVAAGTRAQAAAGHLDRALTEQRGQAAQPAGGRATRSGGGRTCERALVSRALSHRLRQYLGGGSGNERSRRRGGPAHPDQSAVLTGGHFHVVDEAADDREAHLVLFGLDIHAVGSAMGTR